jgi:protoheme ferro-lyase
VESARATQEHDGEGQRRDEREQFDGDERHDAGESGGVRRLVVAPVSIVSDHIETLYELDQLYAGQARAAGVTHYYRARAFNGDPEFPRVLRSVLAEAQLC